MIVSQIIQTDILVYGGTEAAVAFALKEKQEGHRVLLITGFTYFGEEQCAFLDCPDGLTPLTIKRRLDRMVLENHLDFRFRCWPLKLTPEATFFGGSCGIFAVQSRLTVDFSLSGAVARLSADPVHSFRPGKKSWHRTVVSRGKHFEHLEGNILLTEDTVSAWEHAETEIRRRTWSNQYLLTADFCRIDNVLQPLPPRPDQLVYLPEQLPSPLPLRHYVPCSEMELGVLPELSHVQVLVIGAGTAGAPAGIAAARNHASALVLEELAHPGGTGTEGHVNAYWFGLECGFTSEVNREVAKLQGDARPELPADQWSIECKQHYWERELLKAGAEIWYQYSCCGCIHRNGRIEAVIAAGPYGSGLIRADQFIDCTGNADLAAFCGAPTVFADENEPAVQGAAMNPVILGRDSTNTDYMFTTDSSSLDTARAFITGRDRHRNPEHFDLTKLPGTRERRRIVGEIVLQPTDFFGSRNYPDAIHLARSNFDTHGFTVHPFLLFSPADESPKTVQVPLRALLSPGLRNLLTTGLGISAHRDAMPLVRMQADVQNQGYAAGLIAAEAASRHQDLRELDMQDIRKKLTAMDILPEKFIHPRKTVSEPDRKEAEIFQNPDFEMLTREFRRDPDFEKALRLALLGNDTGTGYLQNALKNAVWDPGWNYRGMGQFGMSASRLDCAVMALAGLTEDFSPMAGLLEQLVPESEFSHFRACCLFLIRHPDGRYAAALERLLGQFQCHAIPDLAGLLDSPITDRVDVSERNVQLKELYLAGALHACRPDSPLALDFLKRYASGVHRFFSIFAEKYLA